MEDKIYDVIIIGSGPAGLTAAIYATRGALSTLVIGGSKWGGQLKLTREVENYPGFPEGVQGPELMSLMRKQAERFGAEVKEEDVDAVDFSPTSPEGLDTLRQRGVKVMRVIAEKTEYKGRSVIIATGAETRWLGLPNEEKLIGRGVSSCAPCDAPFFKDKRVFVIGGGDSAMEEALVLSKFAAEITIVHRRDSFRASDIMQKKVLENQKIKVIWNSEVADILGEEKVTGVRLNDVNTQNTEEHQVDGIFVAIGHTPMSKVFGGQIEVDEKGYVKKIRNTKYEIRNEQGEVVGNTYNMMTSVEGVFVAGDVHDHHYRQAVTAAGMGCMAAMDAERWLETQKV